MSAATAPRQHPIARLPAVRGRLSPDAPLAHTTWFRVGGPAEALFRPADRDDLCAFLAGVPSDVPLTVLGVGSNALIRDGGVPGVVIRLKRGFADVVPDPEDATVTAGSGALGRTLAVRAGKAGIGGFAFYAGIPGTLGGALRMNAGAHGTETADLLVWAEAVHARTGAVRTFTPTEMDLGYRHCGLDPAWIFLRAQLRGTPADPETERARMAELDAARNQAQPVRARTSGSTFANPPGAKAWELIDRAGCRGLRVGGAQVSDKHCNFLINTGEATAADLETLGETVRERVREATGVELRWEIQRLGEPGGAP
mgnify:CR=1 FL=1